MHKVKINPISLNQAYRGRRFATNDLKAYKRVVYNKLPKLDIDPKKKLSVSYIFGVSNKNCDGDNLIKCFQDVLALRYRFNDNMIFRWTVDKEIVPKGEEFVLFELKNI
jgi:Holliday junction resolvase RusA-like endonuclease